MKICVVGGNGYVGSAVVNFFKDKHLVSIKEIGDNYENVQQSDLVIICVPTPMREAGYCDVSIVEEIISQSIGPMILIKSTVPPGTTKYLKEKYDYQRIVFSPEYIGEGQYHVPYWKGFINPVDMKGHEFHIFGGDKKDTQEMVEVFSEVSGPYCKYFQTDPTTAELVKYMENSFIAAKVLFCHEFSDIAKEFGVDYHELRELFVADKRMGNGWTSVFKNSNGFDGKCIPKDISGIYHAAKEKGYDSEFLKQIIRINNGRTKES